MIDDQKNNTAQDTTTTLRNPTSSSEGVQLLPGNIWTDEMRLFIARLFVEGYTIRAIRKRLAQDGVETTESQLLQMYADCANDIIEVRNQFEQEVLTTGLARKATRISRLSEMFNTWQEKGGADVKTATLLVKILNQIGNETESISNLTPPPPDDEWHSLQLKLQSQPNLQERETIEAQFSMNEAQSKSKSKQPSKVSS